MKIEKIEMDLIKMICNGKLNRLMWSDDGVNTWISHDGHVAYKIPSTLMYVELKKTGFIQTDFDAFLRNINDCVPAELTNKTITVNKSEYVELIIEGELAYIDKKLLKNFDNPTLTGNGKYNIFYVYEDYNLVGLVMPAKV